ncbi:unnamed protein product [Rotaria socialis]|uniref:Otopetrin n=1 Tax=Rotaria socialis TaxID=392032 RepID=A0A818CYZ7_9BILA|nr:unnamed protein product [Rotaria socialis]CAF4583551.1 unnamed protein product [Rotaria socialis]
MKGNVYQHRFTTENIPMVYLNVPSDEKLDDTDRPRTASYTERLKPLAKRIPSNTSLPCAAYRSRKPSNSTGRPRSVISDLNVYYTPMISDDDDNNDNEQRELIMSQVVPAADASSVIENSLSENENDLIELGKHCRLSILFQDSYWSNHPFSLKGSNAENIDAYKIVSILYGLVIFIGGVAFSISHAIIPREEVGNIRHLAEIYFTYLYWVSILWIVFCIIDIVRHRHKFEISAKAINKLDLNHPPAHSAHSPLSSGKQKEVSPNQHITQTTAVPSFNLQLFDDSDEFQSENNDDDEHTNEHHEANVVKQSHNRDDEDYDDKSLRPLSEKSRSLDNLSMKSSAEMRKRYTRARSVLNRRHALDPGGVHNLRSYVRHRKDSIVQRVMGYNYDDNSTAGGLYIRVGIGIFCLGTVIHSGLSILSNLENSSCSRWTAVMDDSSRLLFSFIQFFFIFKHSNLIIRAHESLARLAVIHIVVTNLCVWFRMVVVETKSQIMEIDAHELAIAQFVGGPHLANGSHQSIQQTYRSTTIPYNCVQSIEEARQMNAFISEGYMRLKPLLYPCTIEFSLMSLTLFYLIWENIGKTFAYKMSDKASTKNVFMVNCHASIKGLFTGMIIFSCTVISIILYAVFRNKIGDDLIHATSFASHQEAVHHDRIHARAAAILTTTLSTRHHASAPSAPSIHGPFASISKTPKKIIYSIAIVEIVNLCLLLISLGATLWALMKIRKLQYKRTTTRFDDVLIIVSLTGTYLYTIFSALALLNNRNQATWIAQLKIVIVVLEFIEATVHAFFILVALRKRLNRISKHQYPAREIITLLIMLDLSLWFEETTTTTKHEANPFQLAFYHTIPWSIIAAIATPLQIFFRFHASVCLSHVWENMYILPAYEPVAPHGL